MKEKQPVAGFCGQYPWHEAHAGAYGRKCEGAWTPLATSTCGCGHEVLEHDLPWWDDEVLRRDGCSQCLCGWPGDWAVMADPWRPDVKDPGHKGRGESDQTTKGVTA